MPVKIPSRSMPRPRHTACDLSFYKKYKIHKKGIQDISDTYKICKIFKIPRRACQDPDTLPAIYFSIVECDQSLTWIVFV